MCVIAGEYSVVPCSVCSTYTAGHINFHVHCCMQRGAMNGILSAITQLVDLRPTAEELEQYSNVVLTGSLS